MRYRDLVPGRLGGTLIGSLIRIEAGGPVPDLVHYHLVDLQLIYCRRGWVRVVYEDQGAPFVLEPGDCVLQAPTIRHRVLESSPGLEVVELSSPAEHETRIDHELALPTGQVSPDRVFAGQRFVRHVARAAAWRPARRAGFEARDLGLSDASGGRLDARVERPAATASPASPVAPARDTTTFVFVLAGSVTLSSPGQPPARLDESDAVTIPAGARHELAGATPALELLIVDVAG
jgi:quercetin dioxygenase-like cupin family protein